MGGYEKLAEMMKALALPVRLQIVEALREEESCVCHLEVLLGQRQAYISQQLSRLRDAGLVVDRREGMNVYYALADKGIEPLLDTARETAVRLASAQGLASQFRPITREITAACPCPKCKAKAGVEVV